MAHRNRVKALGEVFTPTSLVEEVLNYIEQYDPTAFADPTKTFIDSMCGDGQFIVGIQKRKLQNNVPVNTVYGIDLTQDNVDVALKRAPLANIVCADSLGDTFTKKSLDMFEYE